MDPNNVLSYIPDDVFQQEAQRRLDLQKQTQEAPPKKDLSVAEQLEAARAKDKELADLAELDKINASIAAREAARKNPKDAPKDHPKEDPPRNAQRTSAPPTQNQTEQESLAEFASQFEPSPNNELQVRVNPSTGERSAGFEMNGRWVPAQLKREPINDPIIEKIRQDTQQSQQEVNRLSSGFVDLLKDSKALMAAWDDGTLTRMILEEVGNGN